MQLTERDRNIIRLVHRHRFLSSRQIIALIGDSSLQVLRRLKLLYHHGFLERPRAQLAYYSFSGTRPMVYGLSNKSGMMLKPELGDSALWSEKNREVGGMFLEHTLLVSDVMVSLELSCRKRGGVRLLYEDELGLPGGEKSLQWRVKVNDGVKLGVVPDRVFALEYTDQSGQVQRAYFFLEADRGTMPVVRKGLAQTSFYRKLLAYEATWTNKVHQRHLGILRFRVLTVTTNAMRVTSLLAACSQLKRGHGLFLFADQSVLEKDPFDSVWRNGKTGALSPLLDLPDLASSAVSKDS
ncbi:MAG: replication-relaxation family protein [Verrucomicrobiae bacterium]|nr:replication-relaxation family protein [Verrucomicrobiae bacterium]